MSGSTYRVLRRKLGGGRGGGLGLNLGVGGRKTLQ